MAMAKWPCWDLRCILDLWTRCRSRICKFWTALTGTQSPRDAPRLYRLCVSIVHLGHQCMILDMILDGQVLRSR